MRSGYALPREPDPLREHPDPVDRLRLWRAYQDALIHSGVPWAALAGNAETRLQTALRVVMAEANTRAAAGAEWVDGLQGNAG